MYILIAIIFIAELIIALQLILLIRKADKKVCDLNECLKAFNPLAKTCMEYINCLSKNFCLKYISFIKIIKKNQEKFVIKIISTIAIYAVLIFFKIKKIKTKRVFKLVCSILDIATDLAI